MDRYPWLLLAVAGASLGACVYEPPTAPMGDRDEDGPGATPIDPMCLSHDEPTLCMEFEDNLLTDVVRDGSTNRFVALANNLDPTTRTAPVGPTAAKFDVFPLSELVIDADLGLVGDVSVEMWIKLGTSITPRRWLFDSNGRFFMSYDNGDHQIRCGINSPDDRDLRADSVATITDDNWHHVACTFNNMSQQMTVYIDGSVAGCNHLRASITSRPGGTTIGAPHDALSVDLFIGALDSIHVYRRVLDPGSVCKSALGSVTTCATECPSNDGGQGSGGGGFGGEGYGG